MMPKTPFFWYRGDLAARLVSFFFMPAALLFRAASLLRRAGRHPYTSPLPVIAIGNITAGGTGKTPLVAALAVAARKRRYRPVILTRGHGGTLIGPVLAGRRHTATEIGDEARMLSELAPVVIARDRTAGARLIEDQALGDLILMDDGLQNPSIRPRAAVLVFKGSLGVGNGQIIPAGPLRETLRAGLARVDAVAMTGPDETGLIGRIREIAPDLPLFTITRSLCAGDCAALTGRKVIAFAGIGDPDGFFDMLAAAGIELAATRSFPDHHPFPDDDITRLKALAKEHGGILATTEKDFMRLPPPARQNIRSVRLETRPDPQLIDKLLPRR
ncbi:tetraacyldisaccharide 4'-kinase [Alphaproteobacteria bacterium LSUCC0684]